MLKRPKRISNPDLRSDMNSVTSRSTIQALKGILSTALDIQKSCSPLLKNVSPEAKDSSSSSSLQLSLKLSDPMPIVFDLEEIGLTTSAATSISDVFVRSCHSYRTVIEEKYGDACSTGKLPSSVCAQLSYNFKKMYQSKVKTWKDETITAALKRLQEVNGAGRSESSTGCFNYVGTV